MNKVRLLITLLLFVILAAIAYLLLRPKDTPTQPPAPSTQQQSIPQQNSPATTPGSYIDYSPEKVNEAQGRKLLFFHAPWCPQCRALDADIKRQTIPTGMTIFKIDYDSNQALRQKYGVTLQTTVVEIDANGNLLKKFVAYDKPELAAVLQGLAQ